MKIIKKIIQNIGKENSVFYKIADEISCKYGVNIVARTFSYKVDNNESIKFTIKNLQEFFDDWINKKKLKK